MRVAPRPSVTRRPPEPNAERLPSVLAIVATHDGRTWLKDCLVALSAQTYPLLDVLVVDDASTDGKSPPALKRVAKRHLRRRRWGFLRTPRALGFGGAINWALSRVRTDADLLLFLHDDAALTPQSVEHMVARMLADPETAIVGPKVVSWDNPDVLEEVGMTADRFGYPYKGLEPGEIDLGQHDSSTEIFYVTSTCMLVRHDVFRELRGWDARMRVFAEDLDLCWRARVAGHTVRIEPRAKARHAIALAEGLRRSPFRPARYYIRRNRLRTVVKTASGLRLVGLIPQFVLLAFAEMIGFIVLRQPREIVNIARALLWNLLVLPQTVSERARVQRRRKVPDRRLRRLTIRETTRLRFYAGLQADRLESAWGRRTDLLSQRTQEVRSFGSQLMGRYGLVALLLLVALLIGFRHVVWSGPVAAGELLPFPERSTALWRAFVSPWQPGGLGSESASPPAFAFLGFFPLVTLGAAGAAQKLLLVVLGVVAFAGAYRLVAGLVDRPGRYAAGLVYAFGAVGYAGLREGGLGTLAFGAMAPFVILPMLWLVGWMRPPRWNRSRAVAHVALCAAISAAFMPGSLFLYGLAAVSLAGARALLDRGTKVVRGLISCIIGVTAAWALLLPWSLEWWEPGGVLSVLRGDGTWQRFAATFEGHGMASVLAGQTPEGPALFGLALPVLGLTAALVGTGQRRRAALAMWSLVVTSGLVIAAIAAGWMRPLVATPSEGGVLAALGFSALAGLAVGAFRLDLPRRGLGVVHALTIAGMATAAFLIAAGLGPAVWGGAWDPGRAMSEEAEAAGQVGELLEAEALQQGQFRALWVGDRWTAGAPSPALALEAQGYLVTGPRGRVVTELFARSEVASVTELERAIASITAGDTDSGGSLLGAFNVRFIVVRADEAEPWLAQRDLEVIREEPAYLLLENSETLARAGVYPELPASVRALSGADAGLLAERVPPADPELRQESSWAYDGPGRRGDGVVFLAEQADDEWGATAGKRELERVSSRWGNAFALDGSGGALEVRFPRTAGWVVWIVVLALAWTVVIGAAFSRSRPPPPRKATS